MLIGQKVEKKVVSNKRREIVMFRHWTASLAIVCALAVGSAAAAEKQYGPGVTDKEIKIGQIRPIVDQRRPMAPSLARRKSPTSA